MPTFTNIGNNMANVGYIASVKGVTEPVIDKNAYGVVEAFKHRNYISNSELYGYFLNQEPSLQDSSLRWRIHHLKNIGLLVPVKRGVYVLSELPKKSIFSPSSSKKLDKLYEIYTSNLQGTTCALWSTEWLAEFMELQPTHSFIVFEIEKSLTKSLFNILRDEEEQVFLNPEKNMVLDYVMNKKDPVVVKTLTSRSPLQTMENGIPTVSLEKILVDIFCDKDLFITYQGSELKNIFSNAWKTYALNLSTLMNYAQRRNKSAQLLDFLKNNVEELYTVINK